MPSPLELSREHPFPCSQLTEVLPNFGGSHSFPREPQVLHVDQAIQETGGHVHQGTAHTPPLKEVLGEGCPKFKRLQAPSTKTKE